MKFTKYRKAFSMLTAIFVIVIMATVGAMVMSLSGKMVKTTTAQFQREQSMLLAKSYTEYAIMAVMANSRAGAGQCIDQINSVNVLGPFNNGGYNVNVQIAYIGNGSVGVGNCTRILNNAANTANSPLNIILDVYVTYRELDNPYNNQIISYHKRTLQKI